MSEYLIDLICEHKQELKPNIEYVYASSCGSTLRIVMDSDKVRDVVGSTRIGKVLSTCNNVLASKVLGVDKNACYSFLLDLYDSLKYEFNGKEYEDFLNEVKHEYEKLNNSSKSNRILKFKNGLFVWLENYNTTGKTKAGVYKQYKKYYLHIGDINFVRMGSNEWILFSDLSNGRLPVRFFRTELPHDRKYQLGRNLILIASHKPENYGSIEGLIVSPNDISTVDVSMSIQDMYVSTGYNPYSGKKTAPDSIVIWQEYKLENVDNSIVILCSEVDKAGNIRTFGLEVCTPYNFGRIMSAGKILDHAKEYIRKIEEEITTDEYKQRDSIEDMINNDTIIDILDRLGNDPTGIFKNSVKSEDISETFEKFEVLASKKDETRKKIEKRMELINGEHEISFNRDDLLSKGWMVVENTKTGKVLNISTHYWDDKRVSQLRIQHVSRRGNVDVDIEYENEKRNGKTYRNIRVKNSQRPTTEVAGL